MNGERRTSGFGLIEVIVAMLLLGVIALALLPALWQGIQYSSEQSSTATATRFLNSLIEEARSTPDCAFLASLIGRSTTDGEGKILTSAGTVGMGCGAGTAATLTLSITSAGETLAETAARIYIP